MLYSLYSSLIGVGLFVGMLVLIEIGRRAGMRSAAKDSAGARTGLGAIDAAVFSLLGLLVAFTFSAAATRFDTRRNLTVDESNAIGTAWLRLDVLSQSAETDLRELFRQYLDCRLRVAQAMPDVRIVKEERRRCGQLQSAIWTRAASACEESSKPGTALLLLPALNEMFDIASTRAGASEIHTPLIIFALLFLLSLASALLAGYGMAGNRSLIHMVGFAAAVAIAVFVIVDMEFPRAGLIRLDSMDHVFEDLRKTMN